MALSKLTESQQQLRQAKKAAERPALAKAIITMAHSMHRIAIAESVETSAQLDFLRTEGCDEIQGYYFSPPVEGAELPGWVRRSVGRNALPRS